MGKKLMAFLLAISTAAAMIGCGCGTTKENNTTVENTPPETTFESQEEQQPVQSTEEERAKKQENPQITAQEMADAILALDMIQFEGATMPVEEGLLTGFNNAEIKGFKEGVMFAPMIGSIPFVGYVFTLAEETDSSAFVQLLEENADPRWNICTEAEETVVDSTGDMVFFVMCPMQFE